MGSGFLSGPFSHRAVTDAGSSHGLVLLAAEPVLIRQPRVGQPRAGTETCGL